MEADGHKGPPLTPRGLYERRDFPAWSPRWVLRRRWVSLPGEPGRYLPEPRQGAREPAAGGLGARLLSPGACPQ